MKTRTEALRENAEFVKTYDDSKYPKPSVTVDMVIFGEFDGKLKVLLIQRGKAPFQGCYALPGGFVQPNETLAEAARRELREETSLDCKFLEQFGTYSDPGRDPRRWVISNGFMALVDGKSEVIKAGDDAAAAKWFTISLQEEKGEWLLSLTHGEEKLSARLEEITAPWDRKRKFKTIESQELAFDHQLILADAMMQLQSWRTTPLSRIHHIAIIASDYERAKDFYVKKLGFPVIRENYRPDRRDWKLDLRVNEHTELEIFVEQNPPERVNRPEACGLRHLAFTVDCIEETVEKLESMGIVCEPIRVDDYTGKKMTFFHDPDGLPLELHE